MPAILPFEQLSMRDLLQVGGKNASIGELIKHLKDAGVRVPSGFATTAEAYHEFLEVNQLAKQIDDLLAELDSNDVQQLASVGAEIRRRILQAELPEHCAQVIKEAYSKMNPNEQFSVAVRSSATSEDLPEASFAGQQETYLNVHGVDNVLLAVKKVFASLYNDRAISYRVHQGFAHQDIAISAGIQRMVRSDVGSSGVAFSIDTESGFDQVVFITSSYGLGEAVVSGAVNPDEFYVYKPNLSQSKPAILRRVVGDKAEKIIFSETKDKLVETVAVDAAERSQFSLNDDDIVELAQLVVKIERHYGRPMDVEWGKDGIDGHIYILQARPETVQSRKSSQVIHQFQLREQGSVIITGRSIGNKIGQGHVRLISSPDQMHLMQQDDVLVTDMTDPDWEPIMKKAAAIVTNRGGRTCHAAIIARELGIPAVVGCDKATRVLNERQEVTVSCAEGDTGYIYDGKLKFSQEQITVDKMPQLPFDICMNLGNPDKAFSYQALPNHGVGLARLEFIISNTIGIHPAAILNFDSLDRALQQQIKEKTQAYVSPKDYYIQRLIEGVATIGAAFNPKQVIVRLSDFKSNEYANLIGGHLYEPNEENPMIGFRGASRYIDSYFKPCFELECQAIKFIREQMGLTNIQVMVPFVRTLDEAQMVIQTMQDFGLVRGEHGLKILMMCEIPANALLADKFLNYFDGFSIGSNDLTQLTLGLDRDSSLVAHIFDERNSAVKVLLKNAIEACRAQNKYVGICGQGPSDYPDFAKWLMQQGISSVSLVPDSILNTWVFLADEVEA